MLCMFMTDKRFQCPDDEFGPHFPPQCPPVLQGTFSPSSTFSDLYSPLIPPQQCLSGPLDSPYVFSELSSWDSLKLPDKLDDINCKDLSPLNYYDAPVDSQYSWSNNCNMYGLKPGNYSSCAQVDKYYETSTRTAYCSIPKNATEVPLSPTGIYKSCAYYNQQPPQNLYGNYAATYNSYTEPNCSYHEQNTLPLQTSAKEAFGLSYQPSEGSNGESDIVVEDSSSGSSEDQEPAAIHCWVCNSQHRALGLQLYILTSQTPLTISSQIPVKEKLFEFIPKAVIKNSHLCNDCLGLVNSIDHLQFKLNSLIKILLNKCESRPSTRVKPNKGKPQYKCKRCKRVLSVKSLLEKHVRRHKVSGYLCELCGKKLTTAKRLKHHHQQLHGHSRSTIVGFKCSSCAKICRTKFQLKEHENFCLGLLPFCCKSWQCNKKFASATKLKNHIKLKHDKKFVAICSICNIGFVKMSDYKCHMTSHSTEKKFACDQCDKAYKTLTNLNFHRKSHAKVLPFICTICQKGFMRREYHEAHMNNHKGIKNFGCTICEKKFVSQKNLDAHMKYHETSMKTSCPKDHVKLMHSNSKDFESLSTHKKKRKKHDAKTQITSTFMDLSAP